MPSKSFCWTDKGIMYSLINVNNRNKYRIFGGDMFGFTYVRMVKRDVVKYCFSPKLYWFWVVDKKKKKKGSILGGAWKQPCWLWELDCSKHLYARALFKELQFRIKELKRRIRSYRQLYHGGYRFFHMLKKLGTAT